jgi:hypothetical protein
MKAKSSAPEMRGVLGSTLLAAHRHRRGLDRE